LEGSHKTDEGEPASSTAMGGTRCYELPIQRDKKESGRNLPTIVSGTGRGETGEAREFGKWERKKAVWIGYENGKLTAELVFRPEGGSWKERRSRGEKLGRKGKPCANSCVECNCEERDGENAGRTKKGNGWSGSHLHYRIKPRKGLKGRLRSRGKGKFNPGPEGRKDEERPCIEKESTKTNG